MHRHVGSLLVVVGWVGLASGAPSSAQGSDAGAEPRVIDRTRSARVPITSLQKGQASISLLVHDAEVALVDIEMPSAQLLDLTKTDRRELWFITSGYAHTTGYYDRFEQTIGPDWKELEPGGLMDIPAGSHRRLDAANGGMSAVIVYLPGDVEAIVNRRALPGTAVTAPNGHEKPSAVRYQKKLKTHKTGGVRLAVIELAPKRKLPPAGSATELLYVLGGSAIVELDGRPVTIDDTSVVYVPKGATRTLTASTKLRVLQILVSKHPGDNAPRSRRP